MTEVAGHPEGRRTTRGITIMRGDVQHVADTAAQAEQQGFHAAWTPEFYTRSAIVTLAAMGARTRSCRVGSSIAYAVGRSPLVLATEARSLDEVCAGRLILGLGTGTRRMMRSWHGVDPDGPASRLEELVPLLRHIWRLDEAPVKHHGRFYDVEIAPTAEADPPRRRLIPIFTAGVNTRMIEVAGRVADGFLGHPLFTPEYFEGVVQPAIAAGAAKAGRATNSVETVAIVICAVDDDEERARREVAAQIAFYAAPRTYASVLQVAGFDAPAAAVREAFRVGDHDAMVAAVTDPMIDRMAIAGTPDQVCAALARLDGTVDHVIVYPPSFRLSPERGRDLAERLLVAAAPPRSSDQPSASSGARPSSTGSTVSAGAGGTPSRQRATPARR